MNETLSQDFQQRIEQLIEVDRPRLRRLWLYHRNPLTPISVDADDSGRSRPYRQAQEWGLPSRLTGARSSAYSTTQQTIDDVQRKEIVIENDIAWRIDAMVDCLFGKPIVLNSSAGDPDRRTIIETILRQILANHGGVVFLQQLALTGCVHGFVDVLVKFDPSGLADLPQAPSSSCSTHELGDPPACNEPPQPAADDAPSADSACQGPASIDDSPRTSAASNTTSHDAWIARLAGMVRLEIVDPTRALPVLSPTDYRVIEGYAQVYEMPSQAPRRPTWLDKLFTRRAGAQRVAHLPSDESQVVDLITPTHWSRYEDTRLVSTGKNSLGQIPLVHIQNIPLPGAYAGGSEVEPLIPLQDELNTRLSDRANRITMQSFKMYLGKGIEQFTDMPIAPGRMWMTDNEQAEIIEFGGDAACPSEDAHIGELREAMDKSSGVTPIAAGAIRGRIGNLTSAAALKVTLMALISRTEKKRLVYGAGIARICELALAWLDRAGVFPTSADERKIEINWPDPLPQNDAEQLQHAEAKLRLGVPREVILRELGYEAPPSSLVSSPGTPGEGQGEGSSEAT